MKAPTCRKCGRDILLQDEAWNFSALWYHARCNYPAEGWPPPKVTHAGSTQRG